MPCRHGQSKTWIPLGSKINVLFFLWSERGKAKAWQDSCGTGQMKPTPHTLRHCMPITNIIQCIIYLFILGSHNHRTWLPLFLAFRIILILYVTSMWWDMNNVEISRAIWLGLVDRFWKVHTECLLTFAESDFTAECYYSELYTKNK